jgi:hypothetical protein
VGVVLVWGCLDVWVLWRGEGVSRFG